MMLVERVKAILLTPRSEWPRIEAEQASVPGIVRDYLLWLAAIPALATFVGFSIIGFGAFGVTVRVPLLSGLVNAVVAVILTVAMTLAIAKVAELLAPKFGGRGDFLAALKLVAYASTAAMVCGVVYVLPALSGLAILGGLYSVWLLYIGVPVLLKTPVDKSLPFTAVLIVCGVVAGLILGAVSAGFRPGPSRHSGAEIKMSTPKGDVTVNQGALEGFAKKMEDAARKMEAASKSGDVAGVGSAVGAVIGALSGAGERKPVEGQLLKEALPEAVGGLVRRHWETDTRTAFGIAGSRALGEYGDGTRRVRIEITDVGGLSSLMAVAAWAGALGERDGQDGREKTWQEGKRIYQESEQRGGARSGYKLVLGNGVVISIEGHGVDLVTLKKTMSGMNVERLESYQG